MKFTPRQIQENVNISRTSAVREFFMLSGFVLWIAVTIYLVLGFALDILADRIAPQTEIRIAGFFSRKFSLAKSPSETESAVQKIVDDLAGYIPDSGYDYRVHIVKSKEANAFALPGGNILINSALIDEVGSENELAMVLAHEMGHYINRDHLRGLGRGLVLVAFSAFLFGHDSQVVEFFTRVLLTADLRFSRKQETRADIFALTLLHKRYGHVGGAADFFENAIKKRKYPEFLKYFSTHPFGGERISRINEEIAKRGYKAGEKFVLDPRIKELKFPIKK